LPITDVEADAAFAGLARFDHVVLAVSGGPDSVALMVLAAEWRERVAHSTTALAVATVDHGLRAESRREAEHVAAEAKRLGLSHSILTWDGAKPRTGLPLAAREARYRLLEDHARSFGTGHFAIVTAHHLDDQAETLAMRLARGAGIDGLSGMRSERPLHDSSPFTLVRPLLAVGKARLIATLAARGIAYTDDPSNGDQRFERARVRSLLPQLAAGGLTPEALATSARRLNDARTALVYAEDRFVASLELSFGNEVFARFDRRAFDDGPVFLRQKVISRLIGRYGGASPAPQLSEVEDLVARMQRENAATVTLGGAMISCGSRFIRVWREAGRLDHAEISLIPGEAQVWDRRFVLRVTGDWFGRAQSGAVTIKPLGEKGYAAIMSRLAPSRRPPTRAARALPSFWAGETFIAAPSLAPFALFNLPPLDPVGCELNPLAFSSTC
jgi:tRNA(Ile)-lysidine synthase